MFNNNYITNYNKIQDISPYSIIISSTLNVFVILF